jgi:hypothetical protein
LNGDGRGSGVFGRHRLVGAGDRRPGASSSDPSSCSSVTTYGSACPPRSSSTLSVTGAQDTPLLAHSPQRGGSSRCSVLPREPRPVQRE